MVSEVMDTINMDTINMETTIIKEKKDYVWLPYKSYMA